MASGWFIVGWLIALLLCPLYLWWATGVSVKSKWMGAGDDRPEDERG